MTDRAADHAERARAIDPGCSFIVKAPAGSGKTALLIRRYLRLLSVVEHPEEIVAITFTRKAAAEMRVRVLGALDAAASGEAPADPHTQELHALANGALERDAARGWGLRDNPGRLRIQTVDSLCAHLTRCMPVLARFGAQPETLEDVAPLYAQAASLALDELEGDSEWSGAIAELLVHLDNDLPRASELLARMLQRRDQWLRHVVGLQRRELEGALQRLVENTLATVRDAIGDDAGAELAALLDFAAGNLADGDAGPAISACRGRSALPPPAADDLATWQGIAAFLLTAQDDWRRRADRRLGFPAAGSGGTGAATNRAMKERYQALLERFSQRDDLHRHMVHVRNLPAPAYTDAQWSLLGALSQLLRLADARLRVLFAQRNQVDFSGITLAASVALGDEDRPTDLALHLDYRIRHVLVDEFQDISINQYELLRRLTAGWSPDDGHTLFLVGDPMQSIYGFREAEVGLFIDTWRQRRLGQVPVTPLEIFVNFRSSGGIVDWVNRVFHAVLPVNEDASRGAVGFVPARAHHGPGDPRPVEVHAMAGRNARREAELVSRLVREAGERDAHGSTAILVRNRTALPAIVARLQDQGLQFRAIEIEALGHRPAIQDLLALTRAMHLLVDRVAWLAILRAPWCGLNLSDLLVLTGDSGDRTIHECIENGDRRTRLSDDGRARLDRFREKLSPLLARRGRQTLRRWVESAWLALGGPATLRDPSDMENAGTFFALLDHFDRGGELQDPDAFPGEVEALFAAPDTGADERLQIMTIHRAKGLEFDTVIVPGLERVPRSDDPSLLLWAERPAADGNQDLLLAPIREQGTEESAVYRYLALLLREKREYEEGRLMYVAATRARTRLHLIGAVNFRDPDADEPAAPRSGSLLARLWPALREDFRLAISGLAGRVAEDGVAPGAVRRIPRLPLGWEAPAPAAGVSAGSGVIEIAAEDGARVEYEWAGEKVRHVGIAFHEIVQGMTLEAIESWSRMRNEEQRGLCQATLMRLGIPEPDLEWGTAQVLAALNNLAGDPRGRWLFDAGHVHGRNEMAISGIIGGRLVNVRIDRTFVDADGNRWIIDYKTSRHEGADMDTFLDRERERYRVQLERYAALMKSLDARPVRAALYFPLLRGWREWEVTG